MAKPTTTYITSLHTRLTTVWSETWENWKIIDTYLNGTFELWPKDDERPQYHPPTANAKVDQAVSVKLPQKPRVHRYGRDKSATQQRKADATEPWLENMLAVAAMEETQPTISQAKRHLMAYGYTVVEGPVLDAVVFAGRSGGEPKRKDYEDDRQHQLAMRRWRRAKQSNPIRIRAPHPQRVLLHPDEKQPREALKVVQRFKGDLWELMKRKQDEGVKVSWGDFDFDPESNDYYQIVDSKEYWNEDYHTLLGPADVELYTEPNDWGFVPFAHAFSGWGMEPSDPGQLNPKHLAVGLLHPILPSLKLEAQQKSAEHNALIEAAFYRHGYAGNLKPEEVAQALAEGKLLIGKQEQYWVKEIPNLPQWLFQVGAKTNDDIENGTFTRGLGGFKRPGVNTVGQEVTLDSYAEQKFDVPSGQLGHLFSIVCQNALKLVEALGEKVTIRDTTIGPEDINGNYAVEATFQMENPVLKNTERGLGMEEVKAGGKSWKRYYDDLGEEDGLERVREADVEKMLRSEQIMGTVIEMAAAEFKRRISQKNGAGLFGPNGQPASTSASVAPIAPANPAEQAMGNQPGGMGEQQAFNTQMEGLESGVFAG